MFNEIINLGDGDSIQINTNDSTKINLRIDYGIIRMNIKLNFSKARQIITCLQDWVDDNADSEMCEINEESITETILDKGSPNV